MEKKYYIAADGGGSKLHAILYDESYNVIKSLKLSGTNFNFMPKEVVRSNFKSVLDAFLSDEVRKIERMDLCIVSEEAFIREIISEYNLTCEIVFHKESPSSIAAALMSSATTALSGTGSGSAHVKDGERMAGIGGWGPLLGDEGSGYDIGLQALKAAIYSNDGRGEKTVLEELVRNKYKLERYFSLVHIMIASENSRAEIASCATLAAEAARSGDKVAIDIYKRAAYSVFIAFKTVCEKYPEYFTGNVVAIGGAWKGYDGMFEHFCELVHSIYPDAIITKPIYEAVVGPVVRRLFEEGLNRDEIQKKIANGFSSLLYK